jgi:hypothetical protein
LECFELQLLGVDFHHLWQTYLDFDLAELVLLLWEEVVGIFHNFRLQMVEVLAQV